MSEKLNIIGDVYLPEKFSVDFDIDNMVCNFEYPLSTAGIPAKNKINLGSDKSFLLETFSRLPLAVDLANNHIMDYGEEGYLATIDYLERHGIKYFGAGKEENNYNNPCTLDLGGKSIALFGYACPTTSPVFGGVSNNGCARIASNKIIEDIVSSREQFDIIVIQLHWGLEEVPFPSYDDVNIAHKLIDHGADIVIGHHAHVIQSSEVYKGKQIYYGLGNFIFPDIDVPSYFNGSEFESRFSKKQMKSNRESLIVEYDVEKMQAVQRVVRFDGKGVRHINKLSLPKFVPNTKKEFEARLLWHRRLLMVKRFIAEPKLPNISHFKRFFGIE